MPGIRKTDIANRIIEILQRSKVILVEHSFIQSPSVLPWNCTIEFMNTTKRKFSIYFWTISHGGRSRSQNEYRIQTKLKTERRLQVLEGTTILMGIYREAFDRAGKKEGNDPPLGMEVFVSWNANHHLRLGSSSSCQVPFSLMLEAFLCGKAEHTRQISGNESEKIISFRPEYLSSYLHNASGGHDFVMTEDLSPAYFD